MAHALIDTGNLGEYDEQDLFENIANNLNVKGYSTHPNALSPSLSASLWEHLQYISPGKFKRAGVGRVNKHTLNDFIRTDEISWINGETQAGNAWLIWTNALKTYLNQRLFLGLFSFESHFAHYGKGDFYKKHQDAFKGEANRVVSIVVYLNPDWTPDDGGELLIYTGECDYSTVTVTPGFGTIVLFLSEEFPHEVLKTKRDRYSIAGWFRLNSSKTDRVDPPM
jgi:SM-20-related protein